jgi:hypothetical protein
MAIIGHDPFRQLSQLQDRLFRAFDQPYGVSRGTVEPGAPRDLRATNR